MRKLAAKEEEKSLLEQAKAKAYKTGKLLKREIVGLGSGHISRKQLKTIKSQLEKKKPKTEEEKRIGQLAGPKWTKGQYYRGALIGAGLTTGGQLIRAGIQKQKVLDPRALIAAGTVGAIYGSALPAARRLADIEAAKAGVY
jgi:hypothetical protein